MNEKNISYFSSKDKNRMYSDFQPPKIYIEIFLAKKNYIGFCICEIFGGSYRNQITNFYFYPTCDICWLMFLELKEKKSISSIQVSKILIILRDIIDKLKVLQKKTFYKCLNSNFEFKQDLLRILKNYSNVKIVGNTLNDF